MSRSSAITDALRRKGVDAVLITNLTNIRYLSGFTGSSAVLLIAPDRRILFTDFRYKEQVEHEVRGYEVFIEQNDRPKEIIDKVRSLDIAVLGFESTASFAFYRKLLRKGVRIKAVSNLVEDVRKTKDPVELKLIMRAVARAEKAFQETRPHIRKGVSELQIAGLLSEKLKQSGCRTIPFDIIVASGRNASMPHARPTDRKLAAGDFVVVDWGGEADGYFSDMTRTLLVKGPGTSKKMEIYDVVLRANRTAIEAVEDGVHARLIDKAARDSIKKAGYGDCFGHGTGHGVGLEVHESPRISRLGRERVSSGMIFTIEPGVYIPGMGGVRIEDMVSVRQGGRRVLTGLSRELEIIN